MKTAVLGILLALGACSSCAHVTPIPTPNPDGAMPTGCEAVCAHGAVMGCGWAGTTKAGATCQQVCDNASNVGQPWSLDCLSTLTSCDTSACP